MALDVALLCFPGCSIVGAKPERAILIDISMLPRSARNLAKKDQHAATGGGLAANAQCFPLANRDRTLASLLVSPEWGEDRLG
jgi:hypothetical protein